METQSNTERRREKRERKKWENNSQRRRYKASLCMWISRSFFCTRYLHYRYLYANTFWVIVAHRRRWVVCSMHFVIVCWYLVYVFARNLNDKWSHFSFCHFGVFPSMFFLRAFIQSLCHSCAWRGTEKPWEMSSKPYHSLCKP